VRDVVQPHDTLLVVDAMTGQEAVNVATEFNEQIGLTGVILTKIDGDARGGAALSVKEVVGKPILFAGTGEKLDEFEPFHPDRMASRILGMGDVLTLIEKAEQTFDEEEVAKVEAKLRKGELTLQDFLDQMRQVRRMGPLKNVIAMLPGVPKELKDADIDDGEINRIEAIICAMTPAERDDPSIINGSRRARIARGSGVTIQDVNGLLKQFKMVQQMMKSAGKAGKGKRGRMPQLPPGMDLGEMGLH
jgi:signal recognition particle subunit SRP54